MRILQVHNRYRPGWGGEDTVADLEAKLLRSEGNEVERLLVSTAELDNANLARLTTAALGTIWSMRGYFALRRAVRQFSPDIIHVHNTFPLLSPSIFWAAANAGVPVVQTLHNFRLICANALLLRDDKQCQSCVGRFPWAGLRYRCYGGSLLRTLILTVSNLLHRFLGTFFHKVQAYIALTEFSKEILVRAGFPADKIHEKANFSSDLKLCTSAHRNSQLIFVGDISRHKGIHQLLEAWTDVAPKGYKLLIVGDGQERVSLQERYSGNPDIVWLGSLPHAQVMEHIAISKLLILPSLCYENVPMVVVEALSMGTPVIVPDHGAFPRLIAHQQDGLFFSSGSVQSLAATLLTGINASQTQWEIWSQNAGNKFLGQFTSARNYERLMSIYRKTIDDFHSERDSPAGVVRGRPTVSVGQNKRIEES